MTLPSSPRDHLPPPHIHTTFLTPTQQPPTPWEQNNQHGAGYIISGPTVTEHQTPTCSRGGFTSTQKGNCQSSGMPGMLVNRFFMFLFPFEYRSQLFIEHSKVPLHCVVYNYFHFHTRKCIYFLSHCLGELVPCTQVHISEIGAMLAII